MTLLVAALVVLCACAGLVVWAWMLRRRMQLVRNAADLSLKTAESMLAASKQERELAGVLMSHVRKIEDSLVNPRFALHGKSGRVRALRRDERPIVPEESECGRPDENCRQCFGKGWSKRHTQTGVVIPCACVARRRG